MLGKKVLCNLIAHKHDTGAHAIHVGADFFAFHRLFDSVSKPIDHTLRRSLGHVDAMECANNEIDTVLLKGWQIAVERQALEEKRKSGVATFLASTKLL